MSNPTHRYCYDATPTGPIPPEAARRLAAGIELVMQAIEVRLERAQPTECDAATGAPLKTATGHALPGNEAVWERAEAAVDRECDA